MGDAAPFGGRVAGPAKSLDFGFGELPLGEVRQFEIVEEQVEKFVTAQEETESIFTVAFTPVGGPFSAAFARTRKHVTFDVFLVSGKHHVARAALAAKARLIHPIKGYADLAAFQDILDIAVLRGLLDGALNERLGTAQEALAVFKAFAARIQAPIDDVHSHFCIRLLSRLASRVYTIRRAAD